jgi:hypothetical protein
MSKTAFRVKVSKFALALSSCACWSCFRPTRVGRLVIGPSAAGTQDEGDGFDGEPFEITYITSINPEAILAVKARAPWMTWLASNTTGSTYLGNGCEHCGALQGEHFLSEPGGPFFPLDDAGKEAISLTWIETPLQAEVGGRSLGVVWMRPTRVRKERKSRKRSH